MYVCFPLLTRLQVDETNRGHGHLVLCQSSKAVESGTLCDFIHRSCPEARFLEKSTYQLACACLSSTATIKHKQCSARLYPAFSLRLKLIFGWWNPFTPITQDTRSRDQVGSTNCAPEEILRIEGGY